MCSLPPTVVTLDEKKEKIIDEFLGYIYKRYPITPPQLAQLIQSTKNPDEPTPRNPLRLYAYSFLLSRQWNMNAAMAMADDVIKYRDAVNADGRAVFPVPFSVRGWSTEEVQECFSLTTRETGPLDRLAHDIDTVLKSGVHYWDRHGNPVFYVMAGRVNERALLKILKRDGAVGATPAQTLFDFVEHYMIMFEQLCRYQNAQIEKGKSLDGVFFHDSVIRDISVVLDCKGLHYAMLWMPFMDLVKSSMESLFSRFPDCVYQIYLVNAPSVTRLAYAIVKPLLDANTQSKVHIVGPSDTMKELEKLIDPMYIPSFLGGRCKCLGNCVASLDPATWETGRMHSGKSLEDPEEGCTESVKVKAGAKFQKEISVQTGEIIAWSFAGSQIDFYSFFLPIPIDVVQKMKGLSKEKDKAFIISHCNAKSQCDTYTATESGTVVLLFDNSSAWVSSASLDLQVQRTTFTPPELHSDADATSRTSCSVRVEEVARDSVEPTEDLRKSESDTPNDPHEHHHNNSETE